MSTETKSVELTEREANIIRFGLAERDKAIRRKRSWRASEKAVALVENKELYVKIRSLFGEAPNA